MSGEIQGSMDLSWSFSTFDALSNYELYNILKLRQDVFIVEQECAYSDLDNLDQKCIHYTAFQKDKLVGYARIVPVDALYSGSASIGRVIVGREFRNMGIGRKVMEHCMYFCSKRYSGFPIKITAQTYLEKFYQSLGFSAISEPFDWDGIMHIEMTREFM